MERFRRWALGVRNLDILFLLRPMTKSSDAIRRDHCEHICTLEHGKGDALPSNWGNRPDLSLEHFMTAPHCGFGADDTSLTANLARPGPRWCSFRIRTWVDISLRGGGVVPPNPLAWFAKGPQTNSIGGVDRCEPHDRCGTRRKSHAAQAPFPRYLGNGSH